MKKLLNPIFALILEVVSIGGICAISYAMTLSFYQDPKYIFWATLMSGIVEVLPFVSMFALTLHIFVLCTDAFTKREKVISIIGLVIFGILVIAYFVGVAFIIRYIIDYIKTQ